MPGPLDSLLPDPPAQPDAAVPVTCSRAGCRASATAQVNWRNPRIHGIDRVKIWFACDEHRGFLSDYLASRDFPVEVTPLGVDVVRVGTV